MPSSPGAGRFGKFALVGVGNTLVTLAIFNIAVAFGMSAAVANAIGYTVGIANSYAWNRRWTFSDRIHLPRRRTLPRFVAVNLVGLSVTTGLVALLEALAVRWGLVGVGPDVLVLNAIELTAVCAGLLSNFTLSHLWAFAADAGMDEATEGKRT